MGDHEPGTDAIKKAELEKMTAKLQLTRQRIATLEAAKAAARASALSTKERVQEELQSVKKKLACVEDTGAGLDALGAKLSTAQGYAPGFGIGCAVCSRLAPTQVCPVTR
jgi:hypothetical protein